MNSSGSMLSIDEIATMTGLSYHAVRRAIVDRGDLEGIRLGGRIRVRREAYDRWVNRGKIRICQSNGRVASDDGPGSLADLDRIEQESAA